jgi:hypothetical protein
MSFWDNMIGFCWGEEHLPLLIMVVCIAVVLLHFRRDDQALLFTRLNNQAKFRV